MVPKAVASPMPGKRGERTEILTAKEIDSLLSSVMSMNSCVSPPSNSCGFRYD